MALAKPHVVAQGRSILQQRGVDASVTIKANSEVGVIDWFVMTPQCPYQLPTPMKHLLVVPRRYGMDHGPW
ncbi:hypothetical protein GC387_14255 [Pseudomonas sp. MWU12-2323]|nr:hypothetical protein [Pseudomonas sp. MWU12-2323]